MNTEHKIPQANSRSEQIHKVKIADMILLKRQPVAVKCSMDAHVPKGRYLVQNTVVKSVAGQFSIKPQIVVHPGHFQLMLINEHPDKQKFQFLPAEVIAEAVRI